MYIVDDTYTRDRMVSLEQYKKNKIKMLERDFCVPLTDEQREIINGLSSEIAVDRYSRQLLK